MSAPPGVPILPDGLAPSHDTLRGLKGAGPWPEDCDDANPAIHPAAEEICDDGVDNDCDGEIDGCDTGG